MKDSKRQKLPRKTPVPSSLSVVATPIGNLSDFSPRARQALQEADVILCEDTRKAMQLMSALGITSQAQLERCDAHEEHKKSARWMQHLESGQKVVLLSDAGTPGLSDPGAMVLAEALEVGASVSPIPGPSAVAALLSVAPFPVTPFAFRGFFPRKNGEQEKELADFQKSAAWAPVTVWFESPQRIVESLRKAAEVLPEAQVWVGKEITKLHEWFFYGDALTTSQQVSEEVQREGERGEWCFALYLPPESQGKSIDSEAWQLALQCLLEADVPASQAIKQVSQAFGIAKNTVYALAHSKKFEKNAQGG